MSRSVASILFVALASLALLAIGGARQLLAGPDGSNSVDSAPALISFQGYLTDENGDPLADGEHAMTFAVYDAQDGGAKIWEEEQSGVNVSGGYFSVMLGSGSCTAGCPLGAETFNSSSRYLQTTVGATTFPRQQLASVPYALQAEQAEMAYSADHAATADNATSADHAASADSAANADSADSAPWSGLTGVPAGFADGVDDTGVAYENVVTVAKSGGDYTSVATALDSISDSSSDNRYLVRVMSGTYTETALVEVKSYVHVRGSGPNATVITSSRTSNSPNNTAATVDLWDNGRISDLTVRNVGTGTYGIALYSAESSRAAVVDNVVAEAIGDGGTGHFAAYWNDAEAIIRNSTLFAGGATGFGTALNTAFGSVNISGGFPQALIEHSILMGGSASNLENCNDNSGTGYGLQLNQSSPLVRHSYICGGHRGITLYVDGHVQVQNSSVKVSSTGSAYLFEISASGSIKLANSGVSYVGNKFTGSGTSGLSCVHTYDLGTYAPLTDATNSAANACD